MCMYVWGRGEAPKLSNYPITVHLIRIAGDGPPCVYYAYRPSDGKA